MGTAGIGEQHQSALVHQARKQVQQLVDVAALVEHVGGDHEVPGRAGHDRLGLSQRAEQRLDVHFVELRVGGRGAHGVGRIDVVENRLAGIKEREVYVAPAAVVLHTAHKELEKLVIPRDLERVKHDLSRIYADLVYSGQWFSHTRQTIDAFVAAVQPRVTGSVRLKLFKGDCRIVGRKSPYANVAADMLPAAAPQVV